MMTTQSNVESEQLISQIRRQIQVQNEKSVSKTIHLEDSDAIYKKYNLLKKKVILKKKNKLNFQLPRKYHNTIFKNIQMGKQRKCQICPIHNKKHYNDKQKKKCQNQRQKQRKKLAISDKSVVGESHSSVEIFQDFSLGKKQTRQEAVILQESQQPQIEDKEVIQRLIFFGPNTERMTDRIFRRCRQRYDTWGQLIGKRSQQQITRIATLEYETLRGKADKVCQLKSQLDNIESQQQRKKIESLIRQLELQINPHSHFKYILVPSFIDQFELQEFVLGLTELDAKLYDPTKIQQLKLKYEKILQRRKQDRLRIQQQRKYVRITRSGLHHFEPIGHISKDFYNNNKAQTSGTKRRYIRKGKFSKRATLQRKFQLESYRINRGFIRSLHRKQKIGQYRFKLLPGDNRYYGLQPTNDQYIRRLRFKLIYDPWSRLLFRQDAIDQIFGRYHRQKCLMKSRNGKNWQTFYEKPNMTKKCFIENKYPSKPIITKEQAQHRGSLFLQQLIVKQRVDTDYNYTEQDRTQRGGLLDSDQQEPIIRKKIHKNQIFYEDNSIEIEIEQSQSGQIQESQNYQNCQHHQDETDIEMKFNQLKNACIQPQQLQKTQSHWQFVERNLVYMHQKQKMDFLVKYYKDKSTVSILKKRTKSQYYFSYMKHRFTLFQKQKNIEGWYEFMEKYNVVVMQRKVVSIVKQKPSDRNYSPEQFEVKMKSVIYDNQVNLEDKKKRDQLSQFMQSSRVYFNIFSSLRSLVPGFSCLRQDRVDQNNQPIQVFNDKKSSSTVASYSQEERQADMKFFRQQMLKQKRINQIILVTQKQAWRRRFLRK